MSSSHVGKVVVVVDDKDDDLAMVAEWLQPAGYVTKLCSGPAEALKILSRNHVDLVISDIRMPGETGKMDMEAGFKLLAAIRERWPRVPVSLLTGFSVDEYIRCALEHDVGNLLSKAIGRDEFLKCVHMWTTGEGIFGLGNYLPGGDAVTSFEFRTTKEVHVLCNEVEKALADAGFPDTTRGRARIMLEEIAVNAIVHSVDDYGDPLNAPKELNGNAQSARMSFGGTGERFGIAVTDYMGLLTKRRVLESLANVVLEKKGTWQGGRPALSGRGIYMTRAFAREYYINVKRDQITEVVLITDDQQKIPDVSRCSLKINEI